MNDSALVLRPTFSMAFCFYLSVIFIFAVSSLYVIDLMLWLQALVSAILMGIYIFYMRHYLFLSSKKSLVTVLFDPFATSELLFNDGVRVQARWQQSGVINQYVMILRFKAIGSKRSYKMILFFDSIPASTLRELRRRISIASFQ